MKVAYVKKRPDTLSQEQLDEFTHKFLVSGSCGIELEGTSPEYVPYEEVCNFDRAACGVCHPSVCPECRDCNVHRGMDCPHYLCENYCELVQYFSNAHPLVTLEYEVVQRYFADMSRADIRDICRSCDVCNHCHIRNCADCTVCDTCESGARGRGQTKPVLKAIAEELGIICGKIYDTSNLKFNSNWLYVYNDGSVNTELVTAPIQLYRVGDVVKEGLDIFNRYEVKAYPAQDCRAGAHQTFSFDGVFPDIVARNIVQLIRYYLPALLAIGCYHFGTHFRGKYRILPENPSWGDRCEVFNTKYEACHVKGQLALEYKPRLIEFRYPDMTPRWKQHELVCLINAALLLEAGKLSKSGVVSFHNYHWEYVQETTRQIYELGAFDGGCGELRNEMLTYLADSIKLMVSNASEILDVVSHWSVPPLDSVVDRLPKIEWIHTQPYEREDKAEGVSLPSVEWIPDNGTAEAAQIEFLPFEAPVRHPSQAYTTEPQESGFSVSVQADEALPLSHGSESIVSSVSGQFIILREGLASHHWHLLMAMLEDMGEHAIDDSYYGIFAVRNVTETEGFIAFDLRAVSRTARPSAEFTLSYRL